MYSLSRECPNGGYVAQQANKPNDKNQVTLCHQLERVRPILDILELTICHIVVLANGLSKSVAHD